MRRRPDGWLPPGPVPPNPGHDPDLVPRQGETLDSLSGHWRIFQLRSGHRYSTDDLLTAWYSIEQWQRRGATPTSLLDLGCGIGSVLLLTLWAFPTARGVGIEAQPISATLARRSLRYNGAAERASIVEGDFRDAGLLHSSIHFASVTGSPPYLLPAEGRRSDRPQRGPCRFEDRGGIADYLRVARDHLSAGGLFTWVHATRYASQVLEAADASGLRRVRWKEILFREGRESLISVFSAERAHIWDAQQEEDLLVRHADGSWSRDYQAVRRTMGFPV